MARWTDDPRSDPMQGVDLPFPTSREKVEPFQRALKQELPTNLTTWPPVSSTFKVWNHFRGSPRKECSKKLEGTLPRLLFFKLWQFFFESSKVWRYHYFSNFSSLWLPGFFCAFKNKTVWRCMSSTYMDVPHLYKRRNLRPTVFSGGQIFIHLVDCPPSISFTVGKAGSRDPSPRKWATDNFCPSPHGATEQKVDVSEIHGFTSHTKMRRVCVFSLFDSSVKKIMDSITSVTEYDALGCSIAFLHCKKGAKSILSLRITWL